MEVLTSSPPLNPSCAHTTLYSCHLCTLHYNSRMPIVNCPTSLITVQQVLQRDHSKWWGIMLSRHVHLLHVECDVHYSPDIATAGGQCTSYEMCWSQRELKWSCRPARRPRGFLLSRAECPSLFDLKRTVWAQSSDAMQVTCEQVTSTMVSKPNRSSLSMLRPRQLSAGASSSHKGRIHKQMSTDTYLRLGSRPLYVW